MGTEKLHELSWVKEVDRACWLDGESGGMVNWVIFVENEGVGKLIEFKIS